MISAALAAPANPDTLVVSKAAAARFRSEVDIRRSRLVGVHWHGLRIRSLPYLGKERKARQRRKAMPPQSL
jgi:hypothetical protein